MSQKKARAARRNNPGRFAVMALDNQIRDLRAAQTIERREALKVEKAEIKRERAEIRRSIAEHPLRGGLSGLLGRWFA